MSQTDADHAAAEAVVAHHAQLDAELTRRVASLRAAALGPGTSPQWAELRADLVTWLRTELLAHATAEEAALYPPAAAQTTGRLLIDGMVDEHRAIAGLVTELEGAGSAVDAAGAARALAALFEVHLGKENTLVLPLLLDGDVGLAEVLAGMHTLLGDGAESGQGCDGHECACGRAPGRADGPVAA